MTWRELFIKERPDFNQEDIDWMLNNDCPGNFYDGATWACDENDDCPGCWNREVTEETPVFNYTTDTPIAKVTDVKYENGGVTVTAQKIKDSGDRTQFETGAVRDMREGKGRCDLMPLEVAASVINGTNGAILDHIAMFQKTGATAELYLALAKFSKTYDDGKTKASFEDIENQRRSTMLLEVAKHFEEGAKKYGENNWQKGIPAHCYIDSAIRHYLKWLRCDKDEPHDRAFVWNLMCCIWEVDYHETKEDQ